MYAINSTHDPALRSWVESANRMGADFPIQNLPFGVFRRAGTSEAYRGGVAIGEEILDLSAPGLRSLASGVAARALAACAEPTLNSCGALGREAWSGLRGFVSEVLCVDSPHAGRLSAALVPQRGAEYALPLRIGGYTDFYTSIQHATAVGRLFRPDNPLLPNYKWIPIGYHGRTSSIGISGQEFLRPCGQLMPKGAPSPHLAPTQRLDYELEIGVFIGTPNALGSRVPLDAAEEHVFGLCLLNDWSARDIQAWEYQPLGPFLGKNFATTLSPWIVTLEALAPFRVPWTRPKDDPQPLSYLDNAEVRAAGAIDVRLEVWLETEHMRSLGQPSVRLSRSSFRDSYWTVAQLVAHHTVNGCNLEAGDLLGSGTQSGPGPGEAGSLLELSEGGKRPITLPSGEKRTFLADGDCVIFRGWCERDGFMRIGFGEAVGLIAPARECATRSSDG